MGYGRNVEVIYDYIVMDLSQVNVGEKHNYNQREVSQIIREHGFNRLETGAYSSGQHRGKYKNGYKGMTVTQEHIAKYMGSHYHNFDDYLDDIIGKSNERNVHRSATQTQNNKIGVSSAIEYHNPNVRNVSHQRSERENSSADGYLMAIGVVIFVIYLAFNFVLKPGYIAVKELIGDTSYAVTLKVQKDIDFETVSYKDNHFVGSTSFGKPKGFGKMVNPSGDITLGLFNRGKLLGPGIHLNQDDNYTFGNFKKDKLDGLAGEWSNGKLQIGEYHKGAKNGIVAVIGDDGVIRVSEYKKDVFISVIAQINTITKQVDLIAADSKFVSFDDGENVGITQTNAIAYNSLMVKTDGENIAMGYIKWKKPRGHAIVVDSERIVFGTMDRSELKDAILISYNSPGFSFEDLNWRSAFKTISIGDINDKGLDGLSEQYDPALDDLRIGYWNDGIANGKFVFYRATGQIAYMNYREGYPIE